MSHGLRFVNRRTKDEGRRTTAVGGRIWSYLLSSLVNRPSETVVLRNTVAVVCLCVLALGCTAAQAALDGPGSGLVGWWKFDELSGLVASDSSGNGNDGSLTYFPNDNSEWTTGTLGNGLSFGAISKTSTVIVPNALVSDTQDGSYSLWFYDFDSVVSSDLQTLLQQANVGFNNCYGLWYLSGTFYYLSKNADPFYAGSYSYDFRGKWTHIAVTWDSSNAYLYINGIEVSTGPRITCATPTINDFAIGNNVFNAYYPYTSNGSVHGILDDVRVYKRELSPNEVTLLYMEGKRGWGYSGSDQTPIVVAGGNQMITLPNTATLSAVIAVANSSSLTTKWSMVSGPGTVTFQDANALNTTASFFSIGTYVLQLSATDNQLQLTGTANVTIVVNEAISGWGTYNYTLAPGPYTVSDYGSIVQAATIDGPNYYLDPITNQWHYLMDFWYPAFADVPFQLLDLNINTGVTRVANGSSGRPYEATSVLYPNSEDFYFATEGGVNGTLLKYNFNSGTIQIINSLVEYSAHCLAYGDDGAIYIGEATKGYVERYDPHTGVLTNLGIMDDPGPPYYRYCYTLGSDGRYIYIGMNDTLRTYPWYIIVYDQQTKTQTTFWKDLPNINSVFIQRGSDGWYAVQRTNTPGPYYPYTDYYYKLQGMNKPVQVSSMPAIPAPSFDYTVDMSQAQPDSVNGGNITLSWSPTQYGVAIGPWQSASATVNIEPVTIQLLYPFSDSQLLAIAGAYGPVVTYAPATQQITPLGRSIISAYDVLYNQSDNKWYFAGYPTMFMQYDPGKPWTLTSMAIGNPSYNPNIISIAPQGRAKYFYRIAQDQWGTVYLGGHHERDNGVVGGDLAWYFPSTGISDGIGGTGSPQGTPDPLLNYSMMDVKPILNSTKIIYSGTGKNGNDAALIEFDAAAKTIQNQFVPVVGQSAAAMIVEVAPGIIFGVISEGSTGTDTSRIYEFDINTGQLIFLKIVPGIAFGNNVVGQDYRLILGPDGYVWFYLNDTIFRASPVDGTLQPIAYASPSGNLLFFHNDLYIYGGYYSQTTDLRCIRNILVNSSDVSGDGTVSAYDAALALELGQGTLAAAQVAQRAVGLL